MGNEGTVSVTTYTIKYDIVQPLAMNTSPYLYINNRNPHPLISGIDEDLRSSGCPVTCDVTVVGGIKQK